MEDLQGASRLKVTDEHGVIDEAIRDRGEGYTVFSIVRDSIFILFLFLSSWRLARWCGISSVRK